MRCFYVCVALTGALVATVAAVFGGARAGGSAFVGAGLAVVNLWALGAIVSVLVQAAASGQRGGLGFFIVPKTFGLLAIVWLLLSSRTVDAWPLALGYAALPIGVAIGALVCDKAA